MTVQRVGGESAGDGGDGDDGDDGDDAGDGDSIDSGVGESPSATSP